MEAWNKMKRPPAWALRTIQAGRLKGKSDINPQWRYQAMTEVFGPCGIGWKYTIENLWTEPGPDNQVFAFARVSLEVKQDGVWSEPIPGIGGHMLIVKEKSGLHANDEAYKMAVTDALSTAMKMLGVAADVYSGAWDGSKYADNGPALYSEPAPKPELASMEQLTALNTILGKIGYQDRESKLAAINSWLDGNGYDHVSSGKELTKLQATQAIESFKADLNATTKATAGGENA